MVFLNAFFSERIACDLHFEEGKKNGAAFGKKSVLLYFFKHS